MAAPDEADRGQALETEFARSSFAQDRLWFLEQLTPGTGSYVIVHALRVLGRLDPARLERALHRVIQRHEALRTTFVYEEGCKKCLSCGFNEC